MIVNKPSGSFFRKIGMTVGFCAVSSISIAAGGGGSGGGDVVQQACDASNMLPVSANPAEKGPWAVGSRTVTINGLTTEVFYPAAQGSEVGKPVKQWDIRQFLPEEEAAKLPDEVSFKSCESCVDGLPIDEAHGPYPVLIYVHGTAATRIYSLPFFEHWASRGFIVLSADNPNIYQKDALESALNIIRADQKGDTRDLLRRVYTPSYFDGSRFLRGHVDEARIGLGGHSAGGFAIRDLGSDSGVRVIVPMASGGTEPGSELESTLVLGGLEDQTATFDVTRGAYEDSPAKKRLVGIEDMGHVGFVDICRGLALRQEYGLEYSDAILDLLADGCGDEFIAPEQGWEIVNYISTAVYEETLMCSDEATDAINRFTEMYPGQVIMEEQL